jgi:hypothetical protein
MTMIKIDEQYSLHRDPHCWILRETITNKKVTAKHETRTVDSYFSNIVQCCGYALDKKIGNAKSFRDVIDRINEFEQVVSVAVSNRQEVTEPILDLAA